MRTNSRCTPWCVGRERAASHLGADAVGNGSAEGAGCDAGKPEQAAEAAARGREVQKADATAFAANVLPIIETLPASGVRDMRSLASALTNRGVGTARGGRWQVDVKQSGRQASSIGVRF
jgi:hypothetical protein